ncbi:MAG TPA: cysteine--tRNA ligase [Actinomycetota bacterium]|nr:cysteine--tRNA ligase [Actinomycetota bacterium]
MRFYDTLARAVRDLVPLEPGRVTMYTCGPTVYRPVHLGNLRTFLAADLVRRALALEGLAVRQVMNITDVGHMADDSQEGPGADKMLLAAEDEGLAPAEIAAKYTAAFRADAEALHLLPADAYPRATEHVEAMVALTADLVRRGHAYEAGGMVYYDVASFPGYGALSHNTVDRLHAGHRTEGVDARKHHHYDFTLWRAAGPRRTVHWPSPWGPGFPGWHIECSAMSLHLLGDCFDLHTGGADLVFPHHECEIAQSEGAVGHRVVGGWSHAAHLLADGRKMAKSAGNVVGLGDVVARGADPLAFRYLCLQSRYREPANFTWEALEGADRGLQRYRRQVAEWRAAGGAESAGAGLSPAGRDLDTHFRAAIADDLNTPRALTALAGLAGAPVVPAERARLAAGWDAVLGLDLDRDAVPGGDLPPGAAERIAEREQARAGRDFARADRLRQELASLGVEVTDTPEGTRWAVSR